MITKKCSLVVLTGLLLASGITGCALLDAGKRPPKAEVRSIAIIADAQANHATATAIDFVFVYEHNAAALLPNDGPTWFRQRGELMVRLGRDIDVVPMEVLPPSPKMSVDLPDHHKKAFRVIAFANYLAKGGAARMDLTGIRHPTLRLRADRIDVERN